MKLRILAFSLLLVSFSACAWAQRGCSQGQGELRRELWDGYAAEVAPAPSETRAQCRAALLAPDGKVLFETVAAEAVVNEITGRDLNGDTKPDVVLETRRGEPCCYTYSILSPAGSPPLVRQITTSEPLTFEDREGDGKIEISTRDHAYNGFDGLPESQSPAPLVVFRLRGNTLYNVSASYWSEYEMEINQARASVSRNALDLLKSGAGASDPRGKPKELSPIEERQVIEAKGVVLSIALNYLYGGKGQEAWKTIQDMWTDLDKDRIRQLILRTRMNGVLAEVNRNQPAPPASTQ